MPLEREEQQTTRQSPKRKAVLWTADRGDHAGSGDMCVPFSLMGQYHSLKRSGFPRLGPEQQSRISWELVRHAKCGVPTPDFLRQNSAGAAFSRGLWATRCPLTLEQHCC